MNMEKILKKLFFKDDSKVFLKKLFYCQKNNNLKSLKYKFDLNKIKNKYNCYIPLKAEIGENIIFPHGLNGIFISNGAIIGKNCVIFHQVTIGSNTLEDSKNFGAPVIGDNCYIGCGAKIIGKVKIGNKNVMILKFDIEDTEHLNLVSQTIKNVEKTIGDEELFKKKIIFLTIHLKRCFYNEKMDDSVKIKSKNYISHLNQEYEQRFIDNLNVQLHKYKFLRIINLEDIKTIF